MSTAPADASNSTQAAEPTTVAILDRLVAFDTTSRNSNLSLIAFVREHFDRHGVWYRESYSEDKAKANLHAVIGPRQKGGLALSGHVDTVPADGRAWRSDPFRLREERGRLYARGACDMKGFVASMLAAVPVLQSLPLTRPIHLFITFDEETSMTGARRLIADIGSSDLRPDICVVGEPSLMQPVVGHKGRLAVDVSVRGRAGHSSDPAAGVNAVQAAALAIGWIAGEARRSAGEGPFADGYAPPHTTMQAGTVAGGTVLNIIPDRCDFTVEWRTIPGDDATRRLDRFREHVARELEPAMQGVDPACGFTITVKDWVPGMSLPPDSPLASLVRGAAMSNATGHVSYATEGGLYQEAGIATIVCGPGSIEQAHTDNEWIAREQLDQCDAFVRRLAERFAAT